MPLSRIRWSCCGIPDRHCGGIAALPDQEEEQGRKARRRVWAAGNVNLTEN